jgi:DNA-binding response OmpR family regulator
LDTKKRILVVDDEQINLEFFEVMLSKLGFDVHKAENGQEALDSIRRLHPDLVILDNIMPRLSGWEVIKIVKSSSEYADFADIPIIMFSALDDVKDKVEGLELGADDYITKPFNFAEVLARIRAVLRSHELISQIEIREKRIVITEKIAEEMATAFVGTKELLQGIAGATDLNTALKLGMQGAKAFDELERRVSELKQASEHLRKESSDINTMRKRNKTNYR